MKKNLLLIILLVPVVLMGCQESKSSEVSGAAENTDKAAVSSTAVSETVQAENFLLSPTEFKKKIDSEGVIIIDVRTPGELASLGYIKGAEHMDIKSADFKDKIAALDKDKEYYVYCHAGGRSGSAKKMMDKLGFSKVYDLKGGITAWLGEGYEVVK